MRYLKGEILFLLVFITDYIRTELNPDGKHVCLTTENYKETVMVKVQKKKTEKKWCWRGRCSKTNIFYEDEPRDFERTRIVAKCCDGYRDVGQSYCVPACLKGCKNGKCIAPDTCACDPGFHGQQCDKECPEGLWGVNCVNKCTCSDHGKCNKEKGCECKPGWVGDRCELPCQEGYYGYSCEKKCKCDLTCNHETGECRINTLTTVPPAATNYDRGISTNGYHTTEKDQNSAYKGTDRNEVSVSERTGINQITVFEGTERNQVSISEGTERHQVAVFGETERNQISTNFKPDISERLETKNFTEVVDTTESRLEEGIEIEDEISSEIAVFKETESPDSVTSMTEVTKNLRETISANTIPKAIPDPFPTYFTTSTKSEETTEKDEDIKFKMRNEINFLEGLERNASIKDAETTEYATEVSREDNLDKTIINNKTFWISFTNTQQPDGDEIDNLINSEKESAHKDYSNAKFHFFASLSILSGISIIIFAIAAKWIIVSHKRRVQKIIVKAQKEKMYTEQGKGQMQNICWVSGCAENPVYLSDVDINKAVPILQTFKPLN